VTHADNNLLSKGPKRVLHVAGGMDRGGAESMIMNVYRNVDRHRVQFDFLVFTANRCDYDDEINALGGRIFRMNPMNFTRPMRTVRAFYNLINEHGPFQAVHAHTLFNIGWIMLCSRWAKIHIRIAHSHSTKDTLSDSVLRRAYQRFMRIIILLNSTSIVACGRDAGEFLFGKRFSKYGNVVPNAIDVASYQSASPDSVEALSKALKIELDMIVIGQVGTFKRVKNHPHTLMVAKKLLDLGVKFRVVLAGDGELRSALQSYVTEYGLNGYVDFLGLRSDIPVVLRLLDILVMPSLYEGLPVALVEAQAAGIPCLVSSRVTPEADLGTGLIEYLNLNDLDLWIDRIRKLGKRSIDSSGLSRIKNILSQKNYDVLANIDMFYQFYEVGTVEGNV